MGRIRDKADPRNKDVDPMPGTQHQSSPSHRDSRSKLSFAAWGSSRDGVGVAHVSEEGGQGRRSGGWVQGEVAQERGGVDWRRRTVGSAKSGNKGSAGPGGGRGGGGTSTARCY